MLMVVNLVKEEPCCVSLYRRCYLTFCCNLGFKFIHSEGTAFFAYWTVAKWTIILICILATATLTSHGRITTIRRWHQRNGTTIKVHASMPPPKTTLGPPVVYTPRFGGLKLSIAFGYILLRIIFRRIREFFVKLSMIRIYVVCSL